MKFTFNKYNAKKTEVSGIKFASKKEAAYYLQLVEMQKNKEIFFFIRQVPFELPGRIKYLLDYLVFYRDGTVRAIEVKGVRTRVYINKKKMVEELFYPLIIEEI